MVCSCCKTHPLKYIFYIMKTFLVILVSVLAIGCGGNPKAKMCIYPGFTESHIQDFLDAADEWHDKTDGDVNFTFVMGQDPSCDVKLLPVVNLTYDGKPTLGLTHKFGEWIKFNIKGKMSKGGDVTLWNFRETALHEFGHYLTGLDHSDNREDIMYGGGQPVQDSREGEKLREDRHLTHRDIERFY